MTDDERERAEHEEEEARRAVLSRRARFVAAALATAGIATASCGGKTDDRDGSPQPCLDFAETGGAGGAPQVCLGATPTGGAPQVCLEAPLTGGSGGVPMPCLSPPIGTGGDPQVCLDIAPETGGAPTVDAGADAADAAPQVCLTPVP
jgi:hypothetical protein